MAVTKTYITKQGNIISRDELLDRFIGSYLSKTNSGSFNEFIGELIAEGKITEVEHKNEA